jgi:hypothetical protein
MSATLTGFAAGRQADELASIILLEISQCCDGVCEHHQPTCRRSYRLWNNTGATSTFTVYWNGTGGVGLDQFAFNVTDAKASTTGWNNDGAGNMDGFGKFATTLSCPGCTGGIGLANAADIPDNETGAEFRLPKRRRALRDIP